MFWRHSFRNKLIKEVCIEYMPTFVADASVISFAFEIVRVCFPLPLCFFLYICICFAFWIAIPLVFREKWFVKTWERVAKRKSRIAIWNPVRKERTISSHVANKKLQNICVKLIQKTEEDVFNNLDVNRAKENQQFW